MWKHACLTLICGLSGLRALGVAWLTWDEFSHYRALEAAGPPALRIGVHLVFGLALLVTAGGLWQKNRRAHRRAWPLLAAYILWNWLWFALYAQSDFDRGRAGAAGVTSSLYVGFLWWLQKHPPQHVEKAS
jgi:hypothetical protein